MGQNPTGYAAFNTDGRVFLLITGDARKPAKTAEERAELFATLIAYTGTYRVEGDKWTETCARMRLRVARRRVRWHDSMSLFAGWEMAHGAASDRTRAPPAL
jgi:hypothetical protein